MYHLIFLLFVFVSLPLFSWDNWIVVTTIQYPTPQLRKLAQIPGWRLVVVGDKKTPKDWYLENCDYLSPERQIALGYELAELLPWNHYCRKNIGYLYALENGAKIIYETDDDNEAFNGLNPCETQCFLPELTANISCVNVYAYFGHPEIWPRGFPLDRIISSKEFHLTAPKRTQIGIEQGVVNASPDVDAIFRLTQDQNITFEPRPCCFLPRGSFCPFNSQNTFFRPIAFFTLYIPSYVSMRVSDIWRGYVAQRLIWEYNAHVAFSGPNAVQKRNEHSIMNDFRLEQELYLNAGNLVDFLEQWNAKSANDPRAILSSLYRDLFVAGFYKREELDLLDAWLRDLERIGHFKEYEKFL